MFPFIKVYGDYLPRQIFGKFTVLCGIIRMIYLSLILLYNIKVLAHKKPDIIIIDGISFSIPFLRYINCPILFYCHFPDKVSIKYFILIIYNITIDIFDLIVIMY